MSFLVAYDILFYLFVFLFAVVVFFCLFLLFMIVGRGVIQKWPGRLT